MVAAAAAAGASSVRPEARSRIGGQPRRSQAPTPEPSSVQARAERTRPTGTETCKTGHGPVPGHEADRDCGHRGGRSLRHRLDFR